MENLLVDAADVTVHANDTADGWTLGGNIADKTTAVTVTLRNVCATKDDDELIDGSEGAGTYEVRPIYFDAVLSQNIACFDDGDVAWLNEVLKAAADLALGRALVSQPKAGYGSLGVWIGHEDVTTFPFSGNPYTSGPALALAVGRARSKWAKKVVGVDPVLHLSPTLAPVLQGAGALVRQDGVLETIWGDAVVMSPGYDSDDPTDVTPTVFWSGPIKIDLGTAQSTDLQTNTRQNQGIISGSMVAVIDVSPRSIIRLDITA